MAKNLKGKRTITINVRSKDFCNERCPICTRSRREDGYLVKVLRGLVKLYWRACPSCRARFRATGKRPWEG